MRRLSYIFISLALIWAGKIYAQQDPVVSQYMFNQLLLNPAYAGNNDYFSGTLLHRSQWTGWEGAPSTQVFTFHGLLKDKVSGLGLSVSNDQLGVTNQTDFFVNYAYHIRLGKNHNLAFGLKGGLSFFKAKLNELIYWDTDDPTFSTQAVQTNLLPNSGGGAFFNSRRFYAGISVPVILSYDPKEMFSIGQNFNAIPNIRRHYYMTAGYAIEMSPKFVLKPSVLVRYVSGAPVQADLNLNVLLNNVFWVGGSWRTGDAAVGIIEFQATKRLRFGYSYGYALTDISNFSQGTHEIMLGYDFGYQVMKMKTPRYF
jgi:type IX secretion system PorP/SprF family membrane protein